VVRVLRATGANFKYQLAYALKNAQNDPTPLQDFYPGDEYVDMVSVLPVAAAVSTGHSNC
jgi:beta-mannanase